MRLEAPASYRDATEDERDAIAYAVTSLVPDHLLGLPIVEAQRIHAWECAHAEVRRETADHHFYRNMIAMVRARGGPLKYPRRLLAYAFYRSVVRHGEYGKIK